MTTTRTGRPTILHTVTLRGVRIVIDVRPMNHGDNWEAVAATPDSFRVVTIAWNVTRDEAVSAANAEAEAIRTSNFASSVWCETDYDDEEDD